MAGSVRSVGGSWDKAGRSPALHCPPSPTGFLGEGDAVTKAIQDARQLLHSHSGTLESSPSTPFRKVRPPLPLPRGREPVREGVDRVRQEVLMYRLSPAGPHQPGLLPSQGAAGGELCAPAGGSHAELRHGR